MAAKQRRRRTSNSKAVAVYIRVSTEQQRHDSQRHELELYIKAHGLSPIKWYTDKKTGTNTDRPGLDALRADVFAGRVSSVLVYRLDRLCRNLRDGVNLLHDWLEAGVRVVSITQQLDLSGPAGKMVMAVMLALAEIEAETTRERIRAGIRSRKAKGLPVGRRQGDTGHRWSMSKRKIDADVARSLRAKGVPVRQIAQRFGVTPQAVYATLKS